MLFDSPLVARRSLLAAVCLTPLLPLPVWSRNLQPYRARRQLLGTEITITVADDSHRHAGHAGARPEGETHYSVVVVSPAFAGQSRVARSRAAHAALEAEFSGGLHALALRLLTPEEAGAA